MDICDRANIHTRLRKRYSSFAIFIQHACLKEKDERFKDPHMSELAHNLISCDFAAINGGTVNIHLMPT